MRRSAADDGLLGDWLAHYLVFMVITVAAITAIAATWATFALPRVEMWSVVVDTEQRGSARELGVVAEALFRAEATYADVLRRLGIQGGPEELYDIVELRTVPEARLLIVVARTDGRASASLATDAMATALVDAFDRSGYPGFRVLGAPQPAQIPSGLSVPAVTLMGMVGGVILALAAAIVLHRLRLPTLTMDRAARILRPATISSVPGTARFLGTLRPRPPTIAGGGARRWRTDGVRVPGLTLRAPGLNAAQRRELVASLGLQDSDTGDRVVVVCEPRTRERDLRGFVAPPGATLELLWIA